MSKECTKGRVTIPTDVDVVPETLELVERWGADAIRDCDGTDSADVYYDVCSDSHQGGTFYSFDGQSVS